MAYACISMKWVQKLLLITFVISSGAVSAQDETTPPLISLGAYLDIFYGYDFNQPKTKERLPYLYQHNRHASFNLNHAVIAVKLDHEKYRANLAFQSGTYVQDNYAAEPDIYKTIFDANFGLSLNRKNSIWLDVGIFGNSYIGFESTYSFSNFNIAHNLISENSPYYFTGVKATFLPNDHWTIAVLLTNGWQRIQMAEGSTIPSLGTQVTYTGNNFIINWSSFTGTDDPDATRRMRYFNDFYGLITINEHWRVNVGFDVGLQQVSKGSNELNSWFGTAAMAQYTLSDKWQFAGRFEYFSDPNGAIIQSIDNQYAYKTGGYSVNADYYILKNLKWRLEARLFNSGNPIYPKASGNVKNNFFLLTALTFDFHSKPLNQKQAD